MVSFDKVNLFSQINNTTSTDKGQGAHSVKNSKLIVFKRSDGKSVVMTREQYIRYIAEHQRNNQNPAKNTPYHLGKLDNGVRIIDSDSVKIPEKRGSSAPNANQTSPSKILSYQANIYIDNERVDDFRQGNRGDCYLLASLTSIKNTKEGQEVLKNNIQKNGDGSYTVTLPGAVIAKNHYIAEGDGAKCAITGVYRISAAAIKKAQSLSGKSYAYGDLQVILFELAMEAFRAEVVQTNKALGQKSERYLAGQYGPVNESDTLSGGQMYDAVFILTGQKSDVYEAKSNKKPMLYTPGKYGYVDANGKPLSSKSEQAKSGVLAVNHVYNKESDLQKLLDKYEGKEDQFSITVSFRVAKTGPDGVTKQGGSHALTVTKITDDYVEVVNPWDTTKRERIPRDDFEKMATGLTVAPVSERHSDNLYAQLNPNHDNNGANNSILNQIVNILQSHNK